MPKKPEDFDLDAELVRFMLLLNRKELVSRDCRDEIESHLRDEIDDLISHNYSPKEAFDLAIKTFGSGEDLLGEYQKIYARNRIGQLSNILSYYFDRRVVMRVLFGLLFGMLFMTAGILLEGGHLHSILQVSSFIIVIGMAVGALFIAYPFKTVAKSFTLALTGREAVRAAYLDAAKVFSSFGDLAFMAGFVGVIIGTIHVCENLDKLDQIGPGIAVGLMSVLYGLLMKIFVGKPLYDSFMQRAYPSVEIVETAGSGFDDQDKLRTA